MASLVQEVDLSFFRSTWILMVTSEESDCSDQTAAIGCHVWLPGPEGLTFEEDWDTRSHMELGAFLVPIQGPWMFPPLSSMDSTYPPR